jgi:hypothetical protein
MVTLLGRHRVSAAKTFASKLLLGHSDTGNDITRGTQALHLV